MATQAEQLVRRAPPFSFSSFDEYEEALSRKRSYQYDKDQLYHRDGFPALRRLEKDIAELVGADSENVLLTTSGMSAVTCAIELSAPTRGDVVLYPFQGYSQTIEYITDDLAERGIRPKAVDAGSIDDVARALEKHKPKLVVFETVTNSPEMTVLEVERFLKLEALHEVNPWIILDNTLPTDSNLPLAELLINFPLKVLGVESATKSYAFNQDLGGIVFTYNPNALEKIHKKRRRVGATPGPSLVEKLQGTIPPTKEQFDRENRTIAHNTLQLAIASAQAKGGGEKFVVSHPNLPGHSNYDYAQSRYPNGASPVFFIQPADPVLSELMIAKAFERNGVIRDGWIAQSFGFNKFGILYDRGYVRVAGGLENPSQVARLQEQFNQALSSL